MNFIQKLLSQGWIGTIVGLVGIVVAIGFYLRSRRKARLAFHGDHVTLVGGRGAAFADEVEIRFDGAIVPRITASKIVIWNCGDRTINGRDVVDSDPLRVEVPQSGTILKHTILRKTRSVNAWKVNQPSPDRLDLTFDFVDPCDGVTLEVIHSELGGNLEVIGTIRGIPQGMLRYGQAFSSVDRHGLGLLAFSRTRIVLVTFIILGACFMLYGLLRPQLTYWFPEAFTSKPPIPSNAIGWPFVVVGFVYAAFPTFLLWNRRRRYPATLEPEQHEGNPEQDGASAGA